MKIYYINERNIILNGIKYHTNSVNKSHIFTLLNFIQTYYSNINCNHIYNSIVQTLQTLQLLI